MPRLCSRCALTRMTADRTECRACADDAAKHKGFEWQVRKYLEDHEDLKTLFSLRDDWGYKKSDAMDTGIAPCPSTSNTRTWELEA